MGNRALRRRAPSGASGRLHALSLLVPVLIAVGCVGGPNPQRLPLQAAPDSRLPRPFHQVVPPARQRDEPLVELLAGSVRHIDACARELDHWREWTQPDARLLELRRALPWVAMARGWTLWFPWRDPFSARRLASDRAATARRDYHQCREDLHAHRHGAECERWLVEIMVAAMEEKAAEAAEYGTAAVLAFTAATHMSSDTCASAFADAQTRFSDEGRQRLLELLGIADSLPGSRRDDAHALRLVQYALTLLGRPAPSRALTPRDPCERDAWACLSALALEGRATPECGAPSCETTRPWREVAWLFSPEVLSPPPTTVSLWGWLLLRRSAQ